MGVDFSDVVVHLLLAPSSIDDRLGHHIRSESVVDSKMWLIHGDVTQGAVEKISWVVSFIEQSVKQFERSRVISFVHKSIGVHDCVLGFEMFRTKL